MATSVNLTGLQQGSQYDVAVSPYIEGFQLGPPTTITVNTVNGNTTVTSTLMLSPTITPTASKQLHTWYLAMYLHCIFKNMTCIYKYNCTYNYIGTPANSGGSSDEVLSMMVIIIIAAAAGGAIIILLLIVCCCIICAVYRRKRSDKATM